MAHGRAAVGLAFVPIVLVFIQPDFGTALVYGAALAATLFVAGSAGSTSPSSRPLGALVATSVLWALPAVGVEVLKPYQAERLTAFLDPDHDPGGTTYNANQSQVTVGAGGLRGRGVDDSSQTNLDYLPEHETDFAFASLAEQRGFVGASILLCLYLLVLWRGLRIVALARDQFCGDRRRRDRLRAPVPDLRQRRHDDGDRADHGHPAPLRQRRRLVDDREPARDGRAALDRRARPRAVKLHPGLVLGLVRELRRVAGRPGRSSSRARRRSPTCCAGSSAQADAGLVRGEPAEQAAALVHVLAAAPTEEDERVLARAAKARVPIVAVLAGPELEPRVPYVLATDVVRVPAGSGFPVHEIARAIAQRLGEEATSLAAALPVLRRPCATS